MTAFAAQNVKGSDGVLAGKYEEEEGLRPGSIFSDEITIRRFPALPALEKFFVVLKFSE